MAGDTARLRGKFTQAKRGNKWAILFGVGVACAISGALGGSVCGVSSWAQRFPGHAGPAPL